MSQTKISRFSRRLPTIALLLLIVVVAVAGLQRQAIYDWVRLYNYTPPTEISQLATDDTMTASARHLLYINHPVLEQRGTFSKYCPSGTEQSVVLGCYKSEQKGIYLLNISNSELAGIEQVTTAHEMLHAAYDRLSSSERTKINAMLTSYYNNGLTDDTTRATIQAYKKTEPNDVVNEMHSIFGTQVANLPTGLEAYYKRYFTNRSTVTDYYQKYEAAFTERQAKIKDYDIQLGTIKSQVDDLQPTTEKQQSDLKTQRQQLDSERSSNPAAYNAGVGDYNRQVNSYNVNVGRLKALVSQYNDLVAKRNSIALEEQQLVQAITAPALTQ